MKEGMPNNHSITSGAELQRQDEADPIRGAVMRLAFEVVKAAFGKGGPLLAEYQELMDAFSGRFADPKEALRYRLYHFLIGSSPEADSDLFDAEGEDSLGAGIQKLAEKYHIGTDAL